MNFTGQVDAFGCCTSIVHLEYSLRGCPQYLRWIPRNRPSHFRLQSFAVPSSHLTTVYCHFSRF